MMSNEFIIRKKYRDGAVNLWGRTIIQKRYETK